LIVNTIQKQVIITLILITMDEEYKILIRKLKIDTQKMISKYKTKHINNDNRERKIERKASYYAV
jgi:hypothetical protein